MSKISKLISIAFILLLCLGNANAAVTDYNFASSSGTYSAITGGDTYGPYDENDNYIDDQNFEAIDIGFDFTYEGNTYSTMSISTNGYIVMGDNLDVGYYYTGNFTSTVFDNYYIISAFFVDLIAQDGSEIMVLTTGSSPRRVTTIQWTGFKNYSGTNETYNFQIKLYETTNKIEFVYGSFTVDYSDVVCVGLRGNSNTNYQYRTVTSGTNTWSTTANATSNTGNCALTSTLKPSSGQTYTFYLTEMAYEGSEVFQFTDPIAQGSTNQPVIAVGVYTSGDVNKLSSTNFRFSTNGSTRTADITNAKLWYSGDSPYFYDAEQVGSTYSSPNGTFNISTDQELISGDNYFWLTYDIASNAVSGNLVDAECSQITLTDEFNTSSNYTPSPSAPSGGRRIMVPLNGTYTVGTGGNFPNLYSAFDYSNTVGLSGNVTFRIISNITEMDYPYLTQWQEYGNGGYSMTVMPDGGGNRVITAGYDDAFVILEGVSNFTINGSSSPTGTTRELTFVSTGNNEYAGIAIAAVECSNITIKNIIARNANYFDYTDLFYHTRQNLGCIYFDNVDVGLIENCHIYKTNICIGIKNECSDITVRKNLIGSTSDGQQYHLTGINIFSGRNETAGDSRVGEYAVDGFEISDNEIVGGYQPSTLPTAPYDLLRGMLIADGLNGNILRNKVHGLSNAMSAKGTYGIQVSGYMSAGRRIDVTEIGRASCRERV